MFTSSEFYTETQYEIRYEVQIIAHDYKLTNVYIIDMNISWSWKRGRWLCGSNQSKTDECSYDSSVWVAASFSG